MHRHLFFICPTDNLESVINVFFRQENFFCTSLGNSVTFKIAEMGQIKEMIIKHNIQEVSFVLSDDNCIISDAIERQVFSEVPMLKNFYRSVDNQKESYRSLLKAQNEQYLTTSYHLQNKIQELKEGLKSLLIDDININGKIYNRKEKNFTNIPFDLICLAHFNLN